MNKKSTAPQKETSLGQHSGKGITIVRLNEIINLCKQKGVSKIKITGKDVELELFPWAMDIGSMPQNDQSSDDKIDSLGGLGHNDDKTDMDLLLHSARKN